MAGSYHWYKYNKVVRLIYTIFWLIKKPTKITLKHPLANQVQIYDGGKLCLTVNEYNNKTKDTIIDDILDENGKIKQGSESNLIKINMPNSCMRLLIY